MINLAKEVEKELRKDLNNIPKGLQEGWIKDSKEGLDKLSENESDNDIQST